MKTTYTKEVSIEETIKNCVKIITGVKDGKEWTIAVVDKNKVSDTDWLYFAKMFGCQVIACGSQS